MDNKHKDLGQQNDMLRSSLASLEATYTIRKVTGIYFVLFGDFQAGFSELRYVLCITSRGL